jgi:hypothetical protein
MIATEQETVVTTTDADDEVRIWTAQARDPLPDAPLYVGFGGVCGKGATVGGKEVLAATVPVARRAMTYGLPISWPRRIHVPGR